MEIHFPNLKKSMYSSMFAFYVALNISSWKNLSHHSDIEGSYEKNRAIIFA